MKPDDIWKMFSKKRNKVAILLEAIEEMQSYNGRSTIQCIGLAMGLSPEEAYDEVEETD